MRVKGIKLFLYSMKMENGKQKFSEIQKYSKFKITKAIRKIYWLIKDNIFSIFSY